MAESLSIFRESFTFFFVSFLKSCYLVTMIRKKDHVSHGGTVMLDLYLLLGSSFDATFCAMGTTHLRLLLRNSSQHKNTYYDNTFV